jgi:Fe-S-cluster containining protein
MHPTSATGQLPHSLTTQLESLYQELDREIRSLGVGCWIRGDCCDFERCEHQLYASTVELAYVKETHPETFPPDSRLCPFWKEGKCTEHDRRPLGCRTYFCDTRYSEALQELYEKYLRQISALAEEHRFPWRYQPFVAALRSPNRAVP